MNHPGNSLFAILAIGIFLSACASAPPKEVTKPPLPSSREYLARGLAEVGAADTLRREKSPMPVMGGVFGWPPDMEEWSGHLLQAETDFHTILDRFPGSTEAAEAQFMLGWINDHPQRNRFDIALLEYRRTLDKYPGTPAAEKARQRIEFIETIMK